MKINVTLLFATLFAVGLLLAQSGPAQPGSTSRANPRTAKGDVVVQGCLGLAVGQYVLTQLDTGNSYKLEKQGDDVRLDKHLGEQVEVTGWEAISLSTSSEALARAGSSPLTVRVTSIRTIAPRCTAEEVGATSGAQVEISSTPSNADIEIDGKFVGNTPSTVGVVSGVHKLAVTKRGYKPWAKEITVSNGQIRIDATLEPESK